MCVCRQKGLLRRKGDCPVMSRWSNSASVLHPMSLSYRNPGETETNTPLSLCLLLDLPFLLGSIHLNFGPFCSRCPDECREAISSLVYAAARVSEVPELRDLRSLFADRYGSSLEQFVNPEVLFS